MTEGHCWRDQNVGLFDATVRRAAANLRVQPVAVEKDYWVCRALRSLADAHAGAFIFKGGTSLEKLRIIQRFSEDLDVQLLGDHGDFKATKRKMKQMIADVAAGLGGGIEGPESGGEPGWQHRKAYVTVPLLGPEVDGIADHRRVLVELGQSGGPNPHSIHRVTSLLARQLQAGNFEVELWRDLAPVAVPILHPGRTLLEKLLRVNNYAVRAGAERGQDDVHGSRRIGRQLYDVWALLGDATVRSFLRDRQLVAEVVKDIFRVSAAFSNDEPLPKGGLGASEAFDPAGRCAGDLRAGHEWTMNDLYYGQDPGPSFDDVLQRVSEMRPLLDI